MAENQPNVIITRSPKSQGIGVILTLLFGPLGLFYASIIGGVIMCVVALPLVLITFGIGWIIVVPICVVWSLVAVGNYNKNLYAGKN